MTTQCALCGADGHAAKDCPWRGGNPTVKLNQCGQPVKEDTLWPGDFSQLEIQQALCLLAERAGVEFVRTNATKHGRTEIQLRASS